MIEGSDEEYEIIEESAIRKFKHSRIGAKGQMLHPSDNLEWWIFKETTDYIKRNT